MNEGIIERPRDGGDIVERNKDGTFKEGHLKIGGIQKGQKHRPKLLDEIEELLDEIAEGKDYTYRSALKKKILAKMIIEGDTVLIKEFWQQKDGRPRQNLGLDGGQDGEPIKFLPSEIIKKHHLLDDSSSISENSSE